MAPSVRRTIVLTSLACALAAQPAYAATGRPGLENVSSQVQGLVAQEEAGRDVATSADNASVVVTPGDRVLVDVYVNGDVGEAAAGLRVRGLQVLATASDPYGVVEGYLPVDAVREAAQLKSTDAIVAALPGETDAGSVPSEGDPVHRGPEARALGATGAGIAVGVISDSIDRVGGGINDSQASGDLPPDPQVEVFVDGAVGSSDEGRAMAEIIYDTAPGLAKLRFASGTTGGPVGKAASIDNLRTTGMRVIADDIFLLSEPFFQDGVVSQAVDRARAADIAYFASAGNRARQSYESGFRSNGPAEHDFDPGPVTDTVQKISDVPNNRFLQVSFQWDEGWGRAQTDLDIQLVNTTTNAVLATSASDNPVTGLPSEFASYTNTSGASVPVGLRITRFAGTRAPFMKYIARGSFGNFSVAEHRTDSDTINPDAASAQGAIAVAAVAADDPGLNTLEAFSSRGPKTRLFDAQSNPLPAPLVLAKPEIAAADKINTTVPGFVPFFGTSAAAPSAAAIAVLMRASKPSLTANDLDAAMTNPVNTLPCTDGAFPAVQACGAGFILADRLVREALDVTPPAVAPAANGPAGANGYFRGPVDLSWSVSDTGSTIVERAGCDPQTLQGDTTGRLLTCTARSIGGTASGQYLLKIDTAAPSPPTVPGLASRSYTGAALPASSAIACTASDATSGLARCDVTGYRTRLGTHILRATALDNAGLSSFADLTYKVVATKASRLRVARGRGSFRLDAAAKMRFTVQRKAGRRFKTLRGSFSKSGKRGKNSFKLPRKYAPKRLRAGKYRLVGRPVDRYGNAGKKVTAPFTVRR